MKEKVLVILLDMLFKFLTTERIKMFVDAGLDKLEDDIMDDGEVKGLKEKFIWKSCQLIRASFDIPDNDEE